METVDQKSIVFIYDIEQTIEYLIMSCFFKLIGFFVGGCRSDLYHDDTYRCNANATVNLTSEPIDQTIQLEDIPDDNNPGHIVSTVIDRLLGEDIINTKEKELFNELLSVYNEFKLYELEYCEQFYYRMPDKAASSYEQYYNSLSKIREIQCKVEYGDSPYTWHVRGVLMHRLIEIANNAGFSNTYNVSAFIGKLEELRNSNPNFLAIAILIGMLRETDSNLRAEAIHDYDGVINQLKEQVSNQWESKSYLSPVLYKIGHYFENDIKNSGWMNSQKRAHEYYRNSYQSDKYNYRAIYKLAKYTEEEYKNYSSALEFYKAIEKCLQKVKEEDFLQPVEYEYLFKSYYFRRRIIKNHSDVFVDDIDDNLNTIDETINDLVSDNHESNCFFVKFFGEDADVYNEYLNKRLKNIRFD